MDYYVYIDESGQFKNGKDGSVVVGVISDKSASEFKDIFQEVADKIKAEQKIEFNIAKDIHIAPLLHPEKRKKDETAILNRHNPRPFAAWFWPEIHIRALR